MSFTAVYTGRGPSGPDSYNDERFTASLIPMTTKIPFLAGSRTPAVSLQHVICETVETLRVRGRCIEL